MKTRLLVFVTISMVSGILLSANIAVKWKGSKFYSPFKEPKRERYQTIHKRTISVYGAHRNSFLKGHKHAGIDLVGRTNQSVYAIAAGKVVDIQLSFPNLTVLVKHEKRGVAPIYSRYTHVEGIKVKIGDIVDHNTPLARLFNKKELKESRFGVNHLHLEIRKRIDDNCSASWTSLTMKTLNRYCIDPLKFFKTVLR